VCLAEEEFSLCSWMKWGYLEGVLKGLDRVWENTGAVGNKGGRVHAWVNEPLMT
jgi:hypothetical protein